MIVNAHKWNMHKKKMFAHMKGTSELNLHTGKHIFMCPYNYHIIL